MISLRQQVSGILVYFQNKLLRAVQILQLQLHYLSQKFHDFLKSILSLQIKSSQVKSLHLQMTIFFP